MMCACLSGQESSLSPSSLPDPTIPRVTLKIQEGFVVAVTRFELAATEPIVRGFTGQLLGDIQADGMTAVASSVAGNEFEWPS